MKDEEIEEKCDDCSNLLTSWDGALATLYIEDPEECHYQDEAQEYIDIATELAKDMGMTKSVKGHGGEKHIVKQMRMLEGGLVDFDESWAELYHQTGYKFDTKYRNMDENRKAKVRASNDRRFNHAKTIMAEEKVDKEHKRGKRKATLKKIDKQKQIKKERREVVKLLKKEAKESKSMCDKI